MTTEEIDSDIAAKMMAAIDRESAEESGEELPGIDEQKHYLLANINTVDDKDRKAISDIIVRGGFKANLQKCADGHVVSLGSLPETIISQMYIFLEYKMVRRNEEQK